MTAEKRKEKSPLERGRCEASGCVAFGLWDSSRQKEVGQATLVNNASVQNDSCKSFVNHNHSLTLNHVF